MAIVTLEEAKQYLRVDFDDEDALIGAFLAFAKTLSMDVARIPEEKRAALDAESPAEDLTAIRDLLKIAILYSVAYLYEHREKADFTALTLTLRGLLFAVREGVV